jgi:ATP phosphoribosyltransferase
MLKLGFPSKGRLREDAVAWFAAHGVAVEPAGAAREYAARAAGLPDVSVVLLSAGEIPGALAEGDLHAGVTGDDLIRERIPDWAVRVATPLRLGFGRADLVVAVPAGWIDVETMHDLDEAAADFRARHGRPMRVATKYPALARRFFAQAGVADYRLVDSQGATEATPRNGAAELIVDITTSGDTLRANRLRVLDDGLILRSEALLAVARRADWTWRARAALEAMGGRLGFDAAGLGL